MDAGRLCGSIAARGGMDGWMVRARRLALFATQSQYSARDAGRRWSGLVRVSAHGAYVQPESERRVFSRGVRGFGKVKLCACHGGRRAYNSVEHSVARRPLGGCAFFWHGGTGKMPTVYKSEGGGAACIYGWDERWGPPSLAQAALTDDKSTAEEP